jgi:multidrug efflux pump subunit AcrB
VDGQRTVNLTGEVDAAVANANEILADVKVDFVPGFLERHPGVQVSLGGQAQEGAKTQSSMMKAFSVGVFAIFVLLSFQFRSYLEPVVVILAIPLALTGVIWGHLLMGLKISMPSILGFVSLAGVAVNDSILLVEFLKRRAAAGESWDEAATGASKARFRAVLLTSLTTIMGLVPLLSERSLQAQVLVPLANSLVFGLLASTVLILLVIPALYAILGDLGLAKPHHEGWQKQ